MKNETCPSPVHYEDVPKLGDRETRHYAKILDEDAVLTYWDREEQ